MLPHRTAPATGVVVAAVVTTRDFILCARPDDGCTAIAAVAASYESHGVAQVAHGVLL